MCRSASLGTRYLFLYLWLSSFFPPQFVPSCSFLFVNLESSDQYVPIVFSLRPAIDAASSLQVPVATPCREKCEAARAVRDAAYELMGALGREPGADKRDDFNTNAAFFGWNLRDMTRVSSRQRVVNLGSDSLSAHCAELMSAVDTLLAHNSAGDATAEWEHKTGFEVFMIDRIDGMTPLKFSSIGKIAGLLLPGDCECDLASPCGGAIWHEGGVVGHSDLAAEAGWGCIGPFPFKLIDAKCKLVLEADRALSGSYTLARGDFVPINPERIVFAHPGRRAKTMLFIALFSASATWRAGNQADLEILLDAGLNPIVQDGTRASKKKRMASTTKTRRAQKKTRAAAAGGGSGTSAATLGCATRRAPVGARALPPPPAVPLPALWPRLRLFLNTTAMALTPMAFGAPPPRRQRTSSGGSVSVARPHMPKSIWRPPLPPQPVPAARAASGLVSRSVQVICFRRRYGAQQTCS